MPPSVVPPAAVPSPAVPLSEPSPGELVRPAQSLPSALERPSGERSATKADDAEDASPEIRVRARLMVGFEHESERPAGQQTDPAETEYGFIARQIRLGVKGELAERLRFNTSIELADAIEPEVGAQYDEPPYLRTAFVEYRHSRALRLRVGRFKRSFSELELRSVADLPVLGRGLFNSLAIERNQWGDRALGARLSGRIKAADLRWYASFTNPGWLSNVTVQGLDVMGRVEWKPSKRLTLGVNGGFKHVEVGAGEPERGAAYGGDVSLSLAGASFLLEVNDVALLSETGRPRGRGALLLVDYVLPVTENWSLQPTVFAEYVDANTDVLENESLRLVFAVNALGYSGFRVMPQVELVRSIGDTSADNPWPESERLSLILSLAL